MTGKFNVDNISYNFIQGNTILQGCLDIGVEIPRFCYNQKLSIAGNCRMCLVEVAFPKTLKPVASCALPISNNMSIFTNTMLVKKAREGVLEFLLANHPLDCPICDQGGECDLQDQSIFFGSDRGRFYEDKRVVEDKECSPLIKTVMTRCIHCTRCVRFATEIAGINSLGVLGRGASMEIGTYIEQLVDSELSGNIIDLCPVGALTSKPYAFTSRPWELKSFETIDILDSICSRIRVDIRGLEVMRILPSINEDINEDWITDKIRFCYDGLHKHRLCTPVIKIKNFFILLSWENILFFFCQFFGILSNFSNFINSVDNNLKNNITVNPYSHVNKKFSKNISGKFFYFLRFLSLKNKIYFYFGNLIDCETLSAIRNFSFSFGSNNFFLLSNQKFGNNSNDLRNFYLLNCMFSDIEKNDFIFLFNLNPRLELPLLNLKIRKAVLNFGAEVYSLGFLSNTSYSIIQEGVSFKNFFKFLNGKFLSSINVLNMKNSLFLFGSRFLKNFSNFFLFNSLLANSKFFYLNITSINIIHNSSGIINSCEFNVNFFKKSNLFSVKNSLLYLLNIDFMDLSKTVVKDFIKNFTIFQGFLGNYISFCSDFILPSVNFVEKDSFFCNLEGRLQKTKIILNSLTSMRRTDWRILNIIKLVTFQMWGNFGFFRKNFFFYNFSSSKKSIKFFFNKFNTFFKLVDFRKYYMSKINPSFELTGINSININYLKNYNIFLSAKDTFFLTNYFVVSNNFNFFLNNIISYSSKILSISADKFKTRQNNFVFL